MFSEKKSSIIVLSITAFIFFASVGRHSQMSNAESDSLKKEVIAFPGTKQSNLPFSTAIKVGNTMYLSGVIGTDLKTGKLLSPDVSKQTHQCMKKLKIVLNEGGMDFSNVVKSSVYLADIDDYAKMNEAYAIYFKNTAPPARACVQVARLVRDAKVEISMIAIKTN